MTLDELIQHARDNDLVVPATELVPGQLAMIVQWGPPGSGGSRYRDQAPGTVVLRQSNDDYPLIAVKSPVNNEFERGSYWEVLRDIDVMPLTPEHPGYVTSAAGQLGADDLQRGRFGMVTQWYTAPSISQREAVGCVVARERGDRLLLVQKSPGDVISGLVAGQFWAPGEVHRFVVVPVEIQFPYEVAA